MSAWLVAVALPLTGCSWTHGLYNVSLPGGADVGSHPLHVTVEVHDALDLVPQSGVKVNDVAVGKVTGITLAPDRRSANVAVEIRSDVSLPVNAIAAVEQTSLLGEKYVSLGPPLNAAPVGRLADHAVIALARTSDGVEAEQVFGALALLLNGGGIAQLHDIAASLNQVARGHEGEIRRFLLSVDSVMKQLSTHRDAITSALDSLNKLSATLRSRDDTIAKVLRTFSPGVAVLASQRSQFVTMLNALNHLSAVTVSTLAASENEMIADLNALGPTLHELASAGADLPRSLQVLATFPFTDAAVAGVRGDYLNAFVTTALNTTGGCAYPLPAHSYCDHAVVRTLPAAPAVAPQVSGLLPPTTSAGPGLGSTVTLAGR